MGGRCRADGQDALQQIGLRRGGGLFADGDGIIVLQCQHVIPQRVDLLLQFVGAGLAQIVQRVEPQQKQQHIAHRGAQLVAAQGVVRFLDPVVQRQHRGAVVVGPRLVRGFTHGFLQAAVAAGFGKGQQIGLDERIVMHELIVHADFRCIVIFWHHAGDIADHAASLEVFQYADALVSLLHIEAAHILKAADGVADAFIHMRHAEVDPLGAELGFQIEQRHKVAGKRAGAARRFGADDKAHRDLHQAERQLVFDGHVLQNIIQHRQKWGLPVQHFFTVVLLAQLLGLAVFFHRFTAQHGQFLLHRFKPVSV